MPKKLTFVTRSRLAPYSNGRGYRVVPVAGRGNVLEHRLVWEDAHGPIPPGHVIHHINGDTYDNRLANLQMLSAAEHDKLPKRVVNIDRRRGEQHHRAKLTDDDVRVIRARYTSGVVGARRLGREYGVDRSTIRRIVIGQAWRHVD